MLLTLLDEDLLSDSSFLLLYNPREVTTLSADSTCLFIFGVLCIYYDIISILFFIQIFNFYQVLHYIKHQSIYAQLFMIQKYVRSPNSEKYRNKLHIDADNCFDMTLAEMDIGVYEPLHANIMNQFKQLFIEVQTTTPQQNRKKRHISSLSLQRKAKQCIIEWYNSQFLCPNLHLAQHADRKLKMDTKRDTYVLLCTSIVTFCSYCIIALTKQNEIYSSYSSIIKSLNRKVTPTKLIYKSDRITGNFYLDFDDMEKKFKEEKVKMILLSHPHNPSGRVWSIPEIKSIVNLCRKYNVYIVSDQILSDLYLTSGKKAKKFYSFARQFQFYLNIIVLNSISKSFNYSSLQAGYGLTCNENIYKSLNNVMSKVYREQVDGLGIAAICGCLTKQGREWLQIIRSIIESNYIKLINFQQCRAPKLQISLLEAAYILYMNFSSYFQTKKELQKAFSKYNIWVLSLTSNYYPSQQNSLHVRICIACQERHFDLFLIALEKAISQGELRAKL